MIDDHEIMGLLDLHAICGCVTTEDRHTKGVGPTYSCTVSIEHQEVAFDCDKCRAFTENDMRPDIICIQRCDHELGWVVTELKSTMRKHAAKQAKAALKRLGRDPMFPLQLDRVRVFFVIRNTRRTDYTLMREIGTINAGGWRVTPRLLSSDSTIRCNGSG